MEEPNRMLVAVLLGMETVVSRICFGSPIIPDIKEKCGVSEAIMERNVSSF